jgi:DsbC/DsbD-like thiol-disulfide interchange protein
MGLPADRDEAVGADAIPARAALDSALIGPAEVGVVDAAFELRLGEGCKTYWRAPVDAGLPPELDWPPQSAWSSSASR